MPLPEHNPALSEISAYRVPRLATPIDLHLDGNEGAVPPVWLTGALADLAPDVLRRYPDASALEAALARRVGVDADRLLVTAGGDDAIDRIARAFLGPGRRLVLPVPTFEMIPRYARLVGGVVDTVVWRDGPYPVDAVVDAARDDAAMVAVVSPNNPTGAWAAVEDLERLAGALPRASILVDQAYAEFADDGLTRAALGIPQAVVVRSMSKAWGLAGLRVGYALGAARSVSLLRAAGAPYAVSAPSLAMAAAWLERGDREMDRFVERIRQERERLVALLAEVGARPQPSRANFVMARFGDAAWVRQGLAGLGIGVRLFPGQPHLEDALRITCPGDESSFERLGHALRAVLSPQALLFDLDGVLADVSGSYRRAIVETAAAFGLTLGRGDIAAAKAAGNANNDWELTRRLLAARGKEVPLDEVTAVFERLYQGGPGAPGFRESERLTCDPGVLAGLRRKLRLGIVTGRPRADAERFLAAHGVSDAFDAVVTMEDGPLKPDPSPVRRCLERLGVERAWMIGDTPDDIRAARAAGVVPIGMVAPGERREAVEASLLAAGSGRVVEAIEQVEALLP